MTVRDPPPPSQSAHRGHALDLTGRCIAVTGGAGALGGAIVGTLEAHGALIYVLDVAAPPDRPERSLVVDAADPDAVDDAYDRIVADCGRLPSTLLCHAGIVGTHPLVDYPLDEFDSLIRTNVRAAYVPARQLARRWLARGLPGHLVFTTSWVHQVPWPGIGPYSASKAAVVQLTRSFARELAAQRIRANAVAPGIVAAGMAQQQWNTDEDYRSRTSRAIPLGALQDLQSVADAFLFVCSDLARYMTGAVLTVDGGASLYPMDRDDAPGFDAGDS